MWGNVAARPVNSNLRVALKTAYAISKLIINRQYPKIHLGHGLFARNFQSKTCMKTQYAEKATQIRPY